MSLRTPTLVFLALTLAAMTLGAQTFLNEDFSTATGTTPPTGWVTSMNGSSPSPWSFNNPGNRPFDSAFTVPFAICDVDITGSSTSGVSNLKSPAFNATGTTLINLTFDMQFHALQSAGDFAQVEVFDGTMWNVVANYTANVGYLTPNADTTVMQTYDVTMAAAGSSAAQLRFHYGYGWDWWWAVDNVKMEQPSPVDMALISIDAPVDDPNACLPVAGNVPVSVTLENEGSLPVTAGSLIQVQYDLNGGPPTVEFILLSTALNPGDQLPYTFTAMANFPSPGPNTLNVSVLAAGDGDPTDDTASQTYAGVGTMGTVSTFPYLESFDSLTVNDTTTPPTAWFQDQADASGTGSDWFFRSGATNTTGTGPVGDHGTGSGFYGYVEDDWNHGSVRLVSPCFDLSLLLVPELRFWLHSNNNNVPTTSSENFLSVDVIAYPGGAVTIDAGGPYGHQGGAWTAQTVSLAAFSGQVVQIVFRGQSSGGSNQHDIAIDDVAVYDPQPTPGQAPQPGLATLEINQAINVNASPLSLGQGGPYYSTITTGGAMDIEIVGETNSPIAFLAGPLTPVAATYPNIGQLDIGGAVNPMTGIPTAIVVIGDGFTPTSFINAIFNTGPAGTLNLGFQVPAFPLGTLGGFQALLATTNGFFFAISNAVEITVI